MYFCFPKDALWTFSGSWCDLFNFNLKYNHKIISIRRHYNLLYREATIYTMLLGQGRFIQLNLLLQGLKTKLTIEVWCHCHWHYRWKYKENLNQKNKWCIYFKQEPKLCQENKNKLYLISLFWKKNILKVCISEQHAI